MRTNQVIVLRGELDFCDTETVAERLRTAIDRNPLVLVSLRELRFVDCAILGTIVAARTAARERGGDLILAGPHGIVRQLLDITGFPYRER